MNTGISCQTRSWKFSPNGEYITLGNPSITIPMRQTGTSSEHYMPTNHHAEGAAMPLSLHCNKLECIHQTLFSLAHSLLLLCSVVLTVTEQTVRIMPGISL